MTDYKKIREELYEKHSKTFEKLHMSEKNDEITALTAEVERLRAALEEITKKGGPDLAGCITIARAALTPSQEPRT
jgi:uncharacterized small protein (DUF1192 family)